ncbi:MAG: hypothetical protein IJ153_07520 [Clostridia bacterium]|nr:hypothetical protein [Clostridia bacterium]
MLLDGEITTVSHEDLNAVIRLRRNSDFARQYLESGIHPRAFSDTMLRCAELTDLVSLRLKLFSLDGFIGESSGDSLRRKIDGWLKNKSIPNSRDQLVRICYALDMSPENAQNFMATVSEGGFHYRNPQELTWMFGLQEKLPYNTVVKLQEKVSAIRIGGSGVTRDIAYHFQNIRTVDEFLVFVSTHADNLGKLHNAAYYHFTRFMNLLTGPQSSLFDMQEEIYSVRDVVRLYLEMPAVKSQDKTALTKILSHHWPDEILLSRIANRQVDVPRKVLTLLFLITDGGEDNNCLSDDPAEIFADRYRRLNLLLDECSFSPLDPRNAFDWLALYCMYVEDDADVSERMRAVFRENIGDAPVEMD